MHRVNAEEFQAALKPRLGDLWERALTIFAFYGENLSFDVTNVLSHAADQDKVEEVLKILEEHYESHLRFQHPEIRGTVEDLLLGVNPTQAMFLRIFEDTLGLKPLT